MLSKTSGWQFHKWLFRPKKFLGLLRNGALNSLMLKQTPPHPTPAIKLKGFLLKLIVS